MRLDRGRDQPHDHVRALGVLERLETLAQLSQPALDAGAVDGQDRLPAALAGPGGEHVGRDDAEHPVGVVDDLVDACPRGQRGAVGCDELDLDGRCHLAEYEDVGADVGGGEPERLDHSAADRDEPARVHDDRRVGRAGEDLGEVLLQEELVVDAGAAGQEEVAAGALGDVGQRTGVELVRRAEPDGEDAARAVTGPVPHPTYSANFRRGTLGPPHPPA